MSDEQFVAELQIYCYLRQIGGYPIGHPNRIGFQPVVPVAWLPSGHVDRKGTIDSGIYGDFSPNEVHALLEEGKIAMVQSRQQDNHAQN